MSLSNNNKGTRHPRQTVIVTPLTPPITPPKTSATARVVSSTSACLIPPLEAVGVVSATVAEGSTLVAVKKIHKLGLKRVASGAALALLFTYGATHCMTSSKRTGNCDNAVEGPGCPDLPEPSTGKGSQAHWTEDEPENCLGAIQSFKWEEAASYAPIVDVLYKFGSLQDNTQTAADLIGLSHDVTKRPRLAGTWSKQLMSAADVHLRSLELKHSAFSDVHSLLHDIISDYNTLHRVTSKMYPTTPLEFRMLRKHFFDIVETATFFSRSATRSLTQLENLLQSQSKHNILPRARLLLAELERERLAVNWKGPSFACRVLGAVGLSWGCGDTTELDLTINVVRDIVRTLWRDSERVGATDFMAKRLAAELLVLVSVLNTTIGVVPTKESTFKPSDIDPMFVLVHLGGGMTALESGLQAMDAAMGLLK